MMKKIALLTICFLIFISARCALAEENTMSLRFFVPEPIAAFDRIRFLPPDSALPSYAQPSDPCAEEGFISNSENPNYPASHLLFCAPDDNNVIVLQFIEDAWSYKFVPNVNQALSPDFLDVYPSIDDLMGNPSIYISMNTAAVAAKTDPEFKLTLDNDAGILSLGLLQERGGATLKSPQEYTTLPSSSPYEGEGTRLLWYPKKIALRAGHLDNSGAPRSTENFWNDSRIGNYSVAFGKNNLAEALGASILGGGENSIQSNQNYSLIAGGYSNEFTDEIEGDSLNSAITGGNQNYISNASYSFIGGGQDNDITGGDFQTILGGSLNHIPETDPHNANSLSYAFIGGGDNNSVSHYCSVACTKEHFHTIIGGSANEISTTYQGLDIEASNGFIGGGSGNILRNAHSSLIIGGRDNTTNQIITDPAGHNYIIGGGQENHIDASPHATILGGQDNNISDQPYGVIIGGESNLLITSRLTSSPATYSTGEYRRDVIVGGHSNSASNLAAGDANATSCFIGSGEGNHTIGGFVGGGESNQSIAYQAGIGGGKSNYISPNALEGSYIPGGEANHITKKHSWVGGKNMRLDADYSFLWGNSDTPVTVTGDGPKFIILSDHVGIGTLDPQQELEVNGNMRVEGKVYLTAMPSAPLGTGTLFEIDASGNVGFDFAEYFTADKTLEPGTVVTINEQTGLLTKAAQPYDPKVIGIVSTHPAMVFEGNRVIMNPTQDSDLDPSKNDIAVALKGRVPVKVTLENGPITPGDPLTSSSLPGYAMRATDTEKSWGTTIGKALQGFSGGPNGETEGTILTFVTLY